MRCVVIDGRSGSGKTALAASVAGHLGAQILALDDLYPGWSGLAAGSAAVADALRDGRYRRYDWNTGQFAEWVHLDPERPLVIEGCGAITRSNLAEAARWVTRQPASTEESALSTNLSLDAVTLEGSGAVRAIWLDAPEPVRRARALARDGDTFAPHWKHWAAQEDAHFTRHQPWLLAESREPW